jgi:hypothetical protein
MDFVKHLQDRLSYINQNKSQHRWTINDRMAVSMLLIKYQELDERANPGLQPTAGTCRHLRAEFDYICALCMELVPAAAAKA